MRKLIIIRRVSGTSMVPHLRPGVLVLATCWYRTLLVGDIVIVRHEGLEKLKRIARIKQGEVYLLGDNSLMSTDSRHFGWLSMSSVHAKVFWYSR